MGKKNIASLLLVKNFQKLTSYAKTILYPPKKILRMKYLLSILTLCLLIGCSGTNEEEVQNPTPETPLFTIQSISTNSANIGDTITIKGENFTPNAAYTVTFNGTNAQIVEITSVAIRVIVPAGTTPGPLIVASEGTTANAGYVSIIGQNRLFAYKREIIELNSITGAERKFFVYNTESDYLTELEYFAPTHEIIGQGFSNGNGNTYRLFKVKLADKTITETAYKGYDQLIATTTKLYGYRLYEGIVELDPNTGSEIGNLIHTGSDQVYGFIYNPHTNEIMGDKWLLDKNGNNIHKLCKVNLSDHTMTENIYYGYDELIPASNGKLYAYRATKRIVELDPATGAEIKTLTNITDEHVSHLTYYPQTDQIIGKKIIFNNGIPTYKLLKLDLKNNSLSEKNILKDDYDYLVVTD